jgi:hypothetical protein
LGVLWSWELGVLWELGIEELGIDTIIASIASPIYNLAEEAT